MAPGFCPHQQQHLPAQGACATSCTGTAGPMGLDPAPHPRAANGASRAGAGPKAFGSGARKVRALGAWRLKRKVVDAFDPQVPAGQPPQAACQRARAQGACRAGSRLGGLAAIGKNCRPWEPPGQPACAQRLDQPLPGGARLAPAVGGQAGHSSEGALQLARAAQVEVPSLSRSAADPAEQAGAVVQSASRARPGRCCIDRPSPSRPVPPPESTQGPLPEGAGRGSGGPGAMPRPRCSSAPRS